MSLSIAAMVMVLFVLEAGSGESSLSITIPSWIFSLPPYRPARRLFPAAEYPPTCFKPLHLPVQGQIPLQITKIHQDLTTTRAFFSFVLVMEKVPPYSPAHRHPQPPFSIDSKEEEAPSGGGCPQRLYSAAFSYILYACVWFLQLIYSFSDLFSSLEIVWFELYQFEPLRCGVFSGC